LSKKKRPMLVLIRITSLEAAARIQWVVALAGEMKEEESSALAVKLALEMVVILVATMVAGSRLEARGPQAGIRTLVQQFLARLRKT
jgi:hypothetical protein